MQAPVICQLCGAGFLTPKDLWAHAAKEHHSWSEARKRLIFEIQQRTSVPLRPIEKRRHVSNFMDDLLYSYPGRNTVRRNERTMRPIVARDSPFCAASVGGGWFCTRFHEQSYIQTQDRDSCSFELRAAKLKRSSHSHHYRAVDVVR